MSAKKRKADETDYFAGWDFKEDNERTKMQVLDSLIHCSTGLKKFLGSLEHVGITRIYINYTPSENNRNAWQIGIDSPRIERISAKFKRSPSQ